MEQTKFFDLFDAEPANTAYVFSMITARCVGCDVEPDTEKDWSVFTDATISVIRSKYIMPEAMNSYNIVSNLTFGFTVEELAKDNSSSDKNPKIEKIIQSVSRLPIGKNSSNFYLMVELAD